MGQTSSGPEAIEARRLRADLHMRMCIADEAHQEYLETPTSSLPQKASRYLREPPGLTLLLPRN